MSYLDYGAEKLKMPSLKELMIVSYSWRGLEITQVVQTVASQDSTFPVA